MRYAIVKDGKVVNVVKADSPRGSDWIASDVADIGDTLDGEEFVKPGRTVAEIEAAINSKRDALVRKDIPATFPDGEAVIQYRDDRDHNAITAVIQGAMARVMAGAPENVVTFITKDNAQRRLRADEMVQIGLAALEGKQAIYIAARDKKDALDGMTQAELNAYDVDAGWPDAV